jgi:Zn-dependent protease with chaperone function
MMYWALLATLSLACFFLAHAAFGAVVIALARHLRSMEMPPRQAAFTYFALRVAPAILAIIFVSTIAIPSFLRFEPAAANEEFSVPLLGFSLLAAIAIGGVAFRTFTMLWRTHQIVRDWQRRAEPIDLPGVPIRSYRLVQSRPQMAIVGLFRPKLFISSGALELLEPEELQAAIAHEAAHHRAGDLWRQLTVRSLPDVLPGTKFFSGCERMFFRSVEESADEHGAQLSGHAVELASALVKFGKYSSPEPAPFGAYLVPQGHEGELADRVTKLLHGHAVHANLRIPATAIAVFAAAVVLVDLHYDSLLIHAHHAMELLVK